MRPPHRLTIDESLQEGHGPRVSEKRIPCHEMDSAVRPVEPTVPACGYCFRRQVLFSMSSSRGCHSGSDVMACPR
jgi:hypothetical protein